jgi:hypothetical protein
MVPAMIPAMMFTNNPLFYMSAHFEVKYLKEFTIEKYGSRIKDDNDNVTFDSEFANWGMFYDRLGVGPLERDTVQACFGGVFAASVKKIKEQKMEVWNTVEQSLSRGASIQEGHYMERMWGMLLASPLEQYQLDAVKNYAWRSGGVAWRVGDRRDGKDHEWKEGDQDGTGLQ